MFSFLKNSNLIVFPSEIDNKTALISYNLQTHIEKVEIILSKKVNVGELQISHNERNFAITYNDYKNHLSCFNDRGCIFSKLLVFSGNNNIITSTENEFGICDLLWTPSEKLIYSTWCVPGNIPSELSIGWINIDKREIHKIKNLSSNFRLFSNYQWSDKKQKLVVFESIQKTLLLLDLENEEMSYIEGVDYKNTAFIDYPLGYINNEIYIFNSFLSDFTKVPSEIFLSTCNIPLEETSKIVSTNIRPIGIGMLTFSCGNRYYLVENNMVIDSSASPYLQVIKK